MKKQKIINEIKESPKSRIKVNFGTKKYDLCQEMVFDGILKVKKTNPLSDISYYSL